MDEDNNSLIKCSRCGKSYKVHPDKLPRGVTSFNCRGCGTLIPVPDVSGHIHIEDDAGIVLIAVDESELAQLIVRILSRGGVRSMIAGSGDKVMSILGGNSTVDILLLNVTLPDMLGYELIDAIRSGESNANIPVILLSSINHSMRYKRAPVSLYGADEYLERHHLPDMLIPKIARLLEPDPESRDNMPMQEPHTDKQVQERREIDELCRDDEVEADPTKAKMRRMCRVIAGDIALYNEDTINNTSPEKILEAIRGDLEEGASLLTEKFPDNQEISIQILKGEMEKLLVKRGIEIPLTGL